MGCDCEGMNQVHYLNDLLQRALDQLAACLECSVLGSPAGYFISHTKPPDDCCDWLAGWVDRIYATEDFPTEYSGATMCDVDRAWRLNFRLLRSCYPVVKDSATNPFPAPSEIQAAAEKLLIDANVMWCCAESGFNGEFSGEQLLIVPENVVPREPKGGCAGWTLSVVMELDGCC